MLPFLEKQDTSKLYSAACVFPFYFQVPYWPEETFFHRAESSAVEGRSQPGCTRTFFWRAEGTCQPGLGPFWPGEGTSQPVTISKKWKNPSTALCRKRAPEYRPFRDLRSVPNAGRGQYLFPLASRTDLKSLYAGPSPIRKVPVDWSAGSYDFVRILCKVTLDKWPKIYTVKTSTVLYGWWWSSGLGSLED
jgi:hypothetical protein